jgi:mRNA interferase HicA
MSPIVNRDRQRAHPQDKEMRAKDWGCGTVCCTARQGQPRQLFYGTRFTIVRNLKDELKTGTVHAMLGQLGLRLEDL